MAGPEITPKQIEEISRILGYPVRAIAIGTPTGFTARMIENLDPGLKRNYAESYLEVGATMLADACKELGRREMRARLS